MKTFKELLSDLRACHDAMEWAGDRTIEQIVSECHRADWLLWLAPRVGVDVRLVTLTAGHVANTVRHLMIDERSTAAVDAAIAYGEGKISFDDLMVAVAYAGRAVKPAMAARAAWKAADVVATSAWHWAYSESRTQVGADAFRINSANIVRQYMGEQLIIQTNKQLTK
jgi:hypothetical protein